jgi:hypothetical protein
VETQHSKTGEEPEEVSYSHTVHTTPFFNNTRKYGFFIVAAPLAPGRS